MSGEGGVALGRHFGISGVGATIRHGIVAEKSTKDRTLNRQIDRIKKAIINNQDAILMPLALMPLATGKTPYELKVK